MIENIFIILGVIFIYITFGFLLSVILKRNDLADVMWGPGILLAALTSHIISKENNILTLFIITLWAVRIFLHIGVRFLNKKEEDFRYKSWRITWKYFYTRSFFQVFLLQGFLMFMVASSSVYFNLNNLKASGFLFLVFSVLAIASMLYEAVADLQLKKFIKENKDNSNKNVILTSGLWRYSRHPNYFGEVSFWWCIFLSLIFANPSNSFSTLTFSILLISPLTITYLILYVSGIPMLEKKYIDNVEFENYKRKTLAFWPKFF